VDWLPWLATFVAGQATALGAALLIAWIERRWHRQDVRAAQRRARLDERFEPIRRYAEGLQQFVHGAVVWMEVWKENRRELGSQRVAQTVRRQLETQWHEWQELRPQPRPWFVVRDRDVIAALMRLETAADTCRERCVDCLERGDFMPQAEAERLAAQADQSVESLLDLMEQSLATVNR